MHVILRYANGHRAEALLLTMTTDRMRVVPHHRNETVEYRRVSSRWLGDDGTRVSIEALFPATVVQPAGARGLTLSAGN